MSETRDLPSRAPFSDPPAGRVTFGPFTLDRRTRRLWRGETPVQLPSRAVDALAYLIAHRDRVVDKDEIIAAAWRDVAVTDDSLVHAISVIRRALGDDPTQASFIETIPRRGYRFVGPVTDVDTLPGAVQLPAQRVQAVHATASRELASVATSSMRPLAVAAALAVAIAAVALYRSGLGTTPGANATVRVEQVPPRGTTSVSGGVVSPSGRHLAFVARDEDTGSTALWIRALDSSEPRMLSGTDGASKPFFSPDGRTIAFFSKGRLLAADLAGERVRVIAAVNGAPAGGSWGTGDVILFADWMTGLYSIDAAGGPAVPVTQLDHVALDVAHAWPQFLPGGRRFLYQVISRDSSRAGVYAGSIDAPGSVRLLDTASAVAYAPPGFLVYLQQDMLMAQSFDAARLRLGGRPVLVARGVSAPSLTDGNAISGSREILAFREGVARQRLTWVDRSGTPQRTLDVPASMFNFRVSPDGRHLLAASSLTDATGLWLVELGRRYSTRLDADGIAPLWSPDATRFAYTTRGGLDLYLRSSTGDAAARPLISDDAVKVLNDWSPDGRHIVYTQHRSRTKLDLWVVSLSDGGTRPALQTSANEAQARLSPDGKWIAYVSDETGTPQVYTRRYPQLDDPQLVSIAGGGQPQWRADQRELFYMALDGSVVAVTVTGGPRLAYGMPRRLFRTSIEGGPSAARDSYAAMADGQSFLIDAQHNDDGPSPITVMLNWSAGIRMQRDMAARPGETSVLAGR